MENGQTMRSSWREKKVAIAAAKAPLAEANRLIAAPKMIVVLAKNTAAAPRVTKANLIAAKCRRQRTRRPRSLSPEKRRISQQRNISRKKRFMLKSLSMQSRKQRLLF
jgi:hypothetical protein